MAAWSLDASIAEHLARQQSDFMASAAGNYDMLRGLGGLGVIQLRCLDGAVRWFSRSDLERMCSRIAEKRNAVVGRSKLPDDVLLFRGRPIAGASTEALGRYLEGLGIPWPQAVEVPVTDGSKRTDYKLTWVHADPERPAPAWQRDSCTAAVKDFLTTQPPASVEVSYTGWFHRLRERWRVWRSRRAMRRFVRVERSV
jgi:hypothetical protein